MSVTQLLLISLHRPEEKLRAGPPGEGGADQRDDRPALSPPRGSSHSGGEVTTQSYPVSCSDLQQGDGHGFKVGGADVSGTDGEELILKQDPGPVHTGGRETLRRFCETHRFPTPRFWPVFPPFSL